MSIEHVDNGVKITIKFGHSKIVNLRPEPDGDGWVVFPYRVESYDKAGRLESVGEKKYTGARIRF